MVKWGDDGLRTGELIESLFKRKLVPLQPPDLISH